jgi:hypothetical protein
MEMLYINADDSKKPIKAVWKFIFCAVSVIGFSALLLPFQTGGNDSVLCTLIGIGFSGMCVFNNYKGKNKFSPLITFAVITAIMFMYFSRGMLNFMNDIVTLWNRRFETQLVHFDVRASSFDVNVFFTILLSAIGMFSYLIIGWNKDLILSMVLFGIFEICEILRIQRHMWQSLLVGVCIFIFWTRSVNSHIGYARNIWITAVAMTLVGACFGTILSSFNGFYSVEKLRNSITQTVHNIRYGTDTLPDGDMREAYNMMSSDKDILRVTTNNEHEEYLAGFTGSDFDGVKWSSHDNEKLTSDWNGIFRWLANKSFVPQMEYSQYRYVRDFGLDDTKSTIENIGGDRSYIYVPYSLSKIDGDDYSMHDDLSVKADGIFGVKEYKVEHIDHANFESSLVESVMFDNSHLIERSDFSQGQQVYNGFVESMYTYVDDDVKNRLTDVFLSGDNIDENAGLYSVITRIRAVLNLRADYSENPPQYTGDKEFTDWFLNDARSGNSAYFATVGALALRAAGYPARYAEGYYAEKLSNGTTVLTGKNSHAWAEVYVEYAGWIPVEMTPGFYSTQHVNQEIVEISKDVAGGGSDDNSQYSYAEEYKDSDNNDEIEDTSSSDFDEIWELLMGLAATIGAAAIVILIRRPIVECVRRRRVRRGNYEIYVYRYIFKIIRLGGIKCDRASPCDCTEEVCRRFKSVRREEYGAMIALMQKYTFGKQPLKPAEERTLLLFGKKLRRLLYHESGVLKRIKYMFWDCI